VRLYDRLFRVPSPGKVTGNYLDDVNPDAKKVVRAFVEPSLTESGAQGRYQFERHGYFVVDRKDSKPALPVVNRAVTLRDSWAAAKH
jgi:glutaminyl-tRNA synthetase